MKKSWRIFLFLIAVLFITTNAIVADQSTASPLKVGFIMVGPVNDFGWNYAHNQGREFLEKTLNGKVQTTFIENVPENSDVQRVMERMIAQGNKLIFATSYGYLEPALRVAAHHPDVIIMHCGNRSRPPNAGNVGTYFGNQAGAAYVIGTVAGRMTKKNIIGCIGGHPVPQIIQKLNAFALGVHSVNPKAKVHIVWINSWNDPAMESEATQSLIDQGADVISSGDIDSPLAVVRTAARRHIYCATYNGSDMRAQVPDSWLVSAYWNWGPLYVKIAKSVLDHNWKASDSRYGLKDGYIKLSPFGKAVPLAVQSQATDLFKRIAEGRFSIFKGPIKDRDGNLRITEGTTPSDKDLEQMNWLVPGIVGSIPKK